MAGTDPYHLTDKAAVAAAWNELIDEGWVGSILWWKPVDSTEYTARLEMNKNGDKETAIDASIGDVLKPMADRTRFMKFSAADYAELFGG